MLARPMSLASHLAAPKSPVRAWLDARLEDTAPLVKDANERLRIRDALRADAPRIGPGAAAKFCGDGTGSSGSRDIEGARVVGGSVTRAATVAVHARRRSRG